MIILKNTFHNTETKVKKSAIELQEIEAVCYSMPRECTQLERAYVKKIWSKLCGVEGCTCGGTFGERPNYLSQIIKQS